MAEGCRVVLGMDPHKRTVTVEAMLPDETVLDSRRFTTDVYGFTAMLSYARRWADRVWAVEGCEGIGRHVVLRLLDAGEQVVDVPAKLSARMRVYATGQGRKTDDTDAHSIELVGVRMAGLRAVVNDESLAATTTGWFTGFPIGLTYALMSSGAVMSSSDLPAASAPPRA